MTDKLAEVIRAIDGCEGYLIPYPTIKKMHQIKAELQGVIDENTSQPAVEADAEKPCEYCKDDIDSWFNFCRNCGRKLRTA